MDQQQSEFDKAYWLHQPPAVRELAGLADLDARTARAAQLATQGFAIDVPIQVWGWDPFLVMTERQAFGYTWVPSALQPAVTIAPGLGAPGAVPYDGAHPPSGAIRVSTAIADYPPFDPPPPKPIDHPDNADPVGLRSLGNLYLSVPGETYPDGAKFTDARGTFIKHATELPFGRYNYWEKVG